MAENGRRGESFVNVVERGYNTFLKDTIYSNNCTREVFFMVD